jgi:hypothetical protein
MYMKKFNVFILYVFGLMLPCCASLSSVARMTSTNMNKLELGMSKEQVTSILGSDYTIAEKRIEDNNKIEVLSYRDFYRNDEFYMFVFKNDKLEKWYRVLQPKETMKTNQ